jgi:hypothetical protein
MNNPASLRSDAPWQYHGHGSAEFRLTAVKRSGNDFRECQMNTKRILLAAVAGLILSVGAAYADPPHHGGPNHGPGWHDNDRHDNGRHDRYWRPEYRHGYVNRDAVFVDLRRHHYNRFDGAPFFYRDRYVVRTYRDGRTVFVEVNPYTGLFIGEIRF